MCIAMRKEITEESSSEIQSVRDVRMLTLVLENFF